MGALISGSQLFGYVKLTDTSRIDGDRIVLGYRYQRFDRDGNKIEDRTGDTTVLRFK